MGIGTVSRDEILEACDCQDAEQRSGGSGSGVHWSLWGCCREGAGVGVAGHMQQQPKPGVVMSETL